MWFGGSLSCDFFFCLHGVFITEIFNEQTKRQAIPNCAEFSTDIAKVNTWVATSHIHEKLRQALSGKIQLNTSTDHKKGTPGARRLHNNNDELPPPQKKKKLKSYETDPFGTGKGQESSFSHEIR